MRAVWNSRPLWILRKSDCSPNCTQGLFTSSQRPQLSKLTWWLNYFLLDCCVERLWLNHRKLTEWYEELTESCKLFVHQSLLYEILNWLTSGYSFFTLTQNPLTDRLMHKTRQHLPKSQAPIRLLILKCWDWSNEYFWWRICQSLQVLWNQIFERYLVWGTW